MGRDNEAARAIRQAFANYELPPQQIRRQVLLYLDNTLFRHDRDPYRLLGLMPDCSLDDIRLRHKQMLQVFHPDRHPDEEAWFKDRSEQLNRAYAYLKANHGKPGSAYMPYAGTVAGSPPPGPTASAPRQRRRSPPPVHPKKEALRRRLNHWLGDPASLQKRVYIVLFAMPVLALLLLYLSSDSRVEPTASTIVADAVSEAGELDMEQTTPDEQQDAPYHPAMEPERRPNDKERQQRPSDMIAASEAGDRPTETDVAMIEIDHPDEIRVSTPFERMNSAARTATDADIFAELQQDISENHRKADEPTPDPATVISGAGGESIHPADADASAEILTLIPALDPLDPLPERPNPTTAPPSTVPEEPKPATELEEPATPVRDNADELAASDPTEHNQQVDPEAKPEAHEETRPRTELVSTDQTPVPASRASDPGLRSPVAAIHVLLKTYESAYNRSDIDTFANLFRDNARTENAASRSEIREKYDDLFRRTSKRKLVLDDIRVRILDERRYEVKTSYKVDWTYPSGKTSSSTGQYNIHMVSVDGELKIWRLDY